MHEEHKLLLKLEMLNMCRCTDKILFGKNLYGKETFYLYPFVFITFLPFTSGCFYHEMEMFVSDLHICHLETTVSCFSSAAIISCVQRAPFLVQSIHEAGLSQIHLEIAPLL